MSRPDVSSVATRLAEERRRLGLKQSDLAERFGVGRAAVSLIEAGKSALDAERLGQLQADGFDVYYVLTGERLSTTALQFVDVDLYAAVARRVVEWSLERGIRIAPQKEAIIIKLLYLQFAARGRIDDAAFEQTLRVA